MKEYKNCFGCGIENPIGLKLDFKFDENLAECSFTLNKNYEGYEGIIHGGIASTILDEAMAKIVLHKVGEAVTAEMTTKFLKPLKSDTKLHVKSRIITSSKRIIKTEAEIMNEQNEVLCSSIAKFFKINNINKLTSK